MSWHQNHDVIGLIGSIEKDRAWSRFPVLADALEDAGFDDRQALNLMRTDPYDPKNMGVLQDFHRLQRNDKASEFIARTDRARNLIMMMNQLPISSLRPPSRPPPPKLWRRFERLR